MRMRNLMILALAACAIGLAAARAAEDNQAFEKIERGRYLAVLGDCVGCHTAAGGKPFAGGAALETPFGALVGPNITPDVATGIGAWSESDLWRAMHEGIARTGARLYPAMPYPAYTKVTREDVSRSGPICAHWSRYTTRFSRISLGFRSMSADRQHPPGI